MKLRIIPFDTKLPQPQVLRLKLHQCLDEDDKVTLSAVNEKGEHLRYILTVGSDGVELHGGCSGLGIDTDRENRLTIINR